MMFLINIVAYSFILMSGIFTLFLLYLWRENRRKDQSKIPYVSAMQVLWSLLYVYKEFTQEEVKERYSFGVQLIQYISGFCHIFRKEKIVRVSWGEHDYVVLFHPETVEAVLKSNTLINKSWTYDILHPWLGTGLVTSSDDKWRRRRKLLTPAFHFRILENFITIFNEQSKILVQKLRKVNNKEIDMCSFVTPCTLDIVGDAVMGVNLNTQKCSDSSYAKAVKNISSLIIDWLIKPWLWNPILFYLSPTGRDFRKNIAVVHDYGRMVIKRRKEQLLEEISNNKKIDDFQQEEDDLGIKKRRAFLDLLLYHHIMDGSLTEEDVREEVDTFMFAGHDTTSVAICWILHSLGLYTNIQEKVYEEILNVFGEDEERPVTTADLKEMKYLERVVKESLRLYPSVPYIMRKCTEDFKAGDYVISAKSIVQIHIYSIHHNPDLYPNPEVFDPDRFLPQNCEERSPFAFVPFSAGPRNCIGQRFAMIMIKTIVTNILRNFKVHSLQHRDQLCVNGELVLRPEGMKMMTEERVSF